MFISRCGSCHQRGGATEPVNPGDKAAIVWEKYFKRKRHPTSLKELSEDEMQLIIQYLCDHAADSDKPESAAIPK
ncbi:MAG: hypothetical protein JW781_04735 [Deltaproteobacteria bacterium]|nr:hypothetical protein [Candidatus Anaeroferrophillacea bacterium]